MTTQPPRVRTPVLRSCLNSSERALQAARLLLGDALKQRLLAPVTDVGGPIVYRQVDGGGLSKIDDDTLRLVVCMTTGPGRLLEPSIEIIKIWLSVAHIPTRALLPTRAGHLVLDGSAALDLPALPTLRAVTLDAATVARMGLLAHDRDR